MVKELSDSNFNKEVLQHKGKVLVDFWAPWCPPCRLQGPIVEELSKLHPKLKVTKINVDMFKYSAKDYKVSSIPTIIIFENGKMIKKLVGFQSIEKLQKQIKHKRRPR